MELLTKTALYNEFVNKPIRHPKKINNNDQRRPKSVEIEEKVALLINMKQTTVQDLHLENLVHAVSNEHAI